METTERIVESYVRHVMKCATIPNIRCEGQNKIDLLAVNPKTMDRYHIETTISISTVFSKLTGKPFDPEKRKERVQQAGQRRTIGFFKYVQFGESTVIEKLREYGFKPGNYTKAIVSWDWTDEAKEQADDADIELWDFRRMITAIANDVKLTKTYYNDDTLRTLSLFAKALKEIGPASLREAR